MTFVWALLLVVIVVAACLLTVIGMPGNWLVVTAAAVYAFLLPHDGRAAIGWPVVVALVGLAVLGEVVELVAGALGVQRVGGSRRSAVLALGGSVVGGIVGVIVGVPIPIIGSFVGAILFGGLGALTGGMLGEYWKGRTTDEALRVGHAAFWSRLFGTLSKAAIGLVMVIVTIAALLF